MSNLNSRLYDILRWSEKYIKTDMVYLTRGMSWLTIGQLVASASALLLAIVFANFVPKETYGTYKFVLSIVAILSIPTLGGMGTAVINATARGFDKTVERVARIKILWGLWSSLASVILSTYYFVHQNNTLAISFLIAGLFIPAMESYGISFSFLQGKKQFDTSTWYFTISQIISVAMLTLTVLLTDSVALILLAYFVPWTVTRFIFFKLSIWKYSENDKIDHAAITYGKHLSLMGIIGTITGQLDKLLIFHFIGTAGLAIYSIAIAPIEQIKGVLKGIGSLVLPKYSEQSPAQINKGLWMKMLFMGSFLLLISVVYIFCAPFIFAWIFPKYETSVFLSQVYALSMVTSVALFPGNALQALQAKKELYVLSVIVSIVQIISLVIGVYFFGLLGVVGARIFTRVFESLVTTVSFKMLARQTAV